MNTQKEWLFELPGDTTSGVGTINLVQPDTRTTIKKGEGVKK